MTNYNRRQEGHKQSKTGRTYCNVFILHVPNALQHTSPNSIAQILSGGLRVDVPKIDRPVQRLVSVQAAKVVHGVHAIHASELRSERQVGGHGRPEITLALDGREGSLSDEGLGSSSLSSLGSGLLGLGDISASILAIVDALSCPGRLCRESVDNLRSRGCEHRGATE